MELSRAAFAVMVKFTQKVELFAKLIEDVKAASDDIGAEEEGLTKTKTIVKTFRDQASDTFLELLKQWEQAALMRKWTSKVR